MRSGKGRRHVQGQAHGGADDRRLEASGGGAQSSKAEDVAREIGGSKLTLYAWKAKYGGVDVSEAQEVKQLRDRTAECGNTRPMSAWTRRPINGRFARAQQLWRLGSMSIRRELYAKRLFASAESSIVRLGYTLSNKKFLASRRSV
jgi:hypothetical protein